jgi:TRAP-type C4-dicarboxylate transport system substrate-binding protein
MRYSIEKSYKGGETVMKKLLFISLAVILALSVSLIGCTGEGEGEGETVTLKVATYFSAGSAQVAMLEAFCNDLEAASAGLNTTIDTLRYWGGMPVGANDLYDAAVSGSMDIIFVACLYEPGRFPVMDLFAQPLGIPHAWCGSHVVQDFYNNFTGTTNFTAFNDTRPLFLSLSAPLVMYTKFEGVDAAAFSGKKIRTGMPNKCILDSLGATISTIGMPDVYNALNTGQIDGVMIGADGYTVWNLQDVTTNLTLPYVGGGDVFITTMNKAKYASLPADVQAVIDSVSASYANTVCTMWTNVNKASLSLGKSSGIGFICLNSSERAAWQTAMAGCTPNWINTTMAGKGYDTTVVQGWVDYVQARLAYWMGVQNATPGIGWHDCYTYTP